MSTGLPPAERPRWWRVVDWRLVSAVGLPLWAFLIGLMIPRKVEPAVAGGPPVVTPAEDNTIPPPRAIVVRESPPTVVTVPVPVPVVEETLVIAPGVPEFKLPDAEVMPADKCKQFGTKIRFHGTPVEAATEAKASKKMMMVLHISGNFEDPGFT